MKTYKWNDLSKRQQDMARNVAEKSGQQVTASQAAKYLDYIFALRRGGLGAAQFEKETGIKAELVK